MDQNNYPNNGYPQQPQMQPGMGYPQQPQMQPGMGMQTGMQAGMGMQPGVQPQMQNGYPQQQMQPGMGMQPGMQAGMGMQPQMGGGQPPKKKSNAGLIIGIIVAVLAVAGLVVFLLRDKIFGGKLSGGYDSPEKVCTAMFESMENVDKDKMATCFVEDASTTQRDIDANYAQAQAIDSYTTIHTSDIKTTVSDYSDKDGLKSRGFKLKDAKSVHVEVPMTQEIDGFKYEVLDIYDGCVVQMKNDKWYIVDLGETDVQIVSTDMDDILDGLDDIDDDLDLDGLDDLDIDDITTEADDDDHTVAAGKKAMGDAINGYVDVDDDWQAFYEIGGIEGTYSDVQFSTRDQKAIVTLCTYEANADEYDVANNLADSFKEEADVDADSVSVSSALLGGYTGYQVRAYYPGDDTELVIWVFYAPDQDSYLHYVAVEYTPEYSYAETYVISSFRFTE